MGTRKIKRRHRKVRGGVLKGVAAVSDDKVDPNAALSDAALSDVVDPNAVDPNAAVSDAALSDVVDPNAVDPNFAVSDAVDPNAAVSDDEVKKEEQKQIEESLKDVITEFPEAKEIIDKNPIAGHAISLLQNVFPNSAKRLATFLKDNKESINGIIDEMNKMPYDKQAQIFSERIKTMPDLSEDDKQLLEKGITTDAIISNVNIMKDEIKTRLNKPPSLENTDFPGASVDKTGDKLQVIFNMNKPGGKRKTKRSKKSTKSKTKKSIKRRRTHKKKSKK